MFAVVAVVRDVAPGEVVRAEDLTVAQNLFLGREVRRGRRYGTIMVDLERRRVQRELCAARAELPGEAQTQTRVSPIGAWGK